MNVVVRFLIITIVFLHVLIVLVVLVIVLIVSSGKLSVIGHRMDGGTCAVNVRCQKCNIGQVYATWTTIKTKPAMTKTTKDWKHQVATCSADHVGEWHGEWELCRLVETVGEQCRVICMLDNKEVNVPKRFVRLRTYRSYIVVNCEARKMVLAFLVAGCGYSRYRDFCRV